MTRSAISPRLAMRTFRNIFSSTQSQGPQSEERLAIFDRLSVRDQALDDLACCVRFDLVHQLHGFDDAEHLPVLNLVA